MEACLEKKVKIDFVEVTKKELECGLYDNLLYAKNAMMFSPSLDSIELYQQHKEKFYQYILDDNIKSLNSFFLVSDCYLWEEIKK